MEGPLTLSDQELNYYHNLFRGCDVDGSGKIPGVKALELFKAAGLTTDILAQISELCGAKRLGHYGRSQFFVALKLIVAAQNGLPIKLDNINMAKQMTLPTFFMAAELAKSEALRIETELTSTGDGIKGYAPAGHIPPPPTKKHGRNASGQWRGVVTQQSQPEPTYVNVAQVINNNSGDPPVPPQEPRSPHFSPANTPPTSPSVTKPTHKQQSPVIIRQPVKPATNSFAYTTEDPAGWANFDDDDGRGLLGSGIKRISEHLDLHTFDSSSMSSEAESLDDIWSINDEQRDYYVQQFKTMQMDLNGVITGNVAKEFFEKSKLPVQELSQIWQLSDVNKDGALSLEEFCTAMHLVVLRRNDIELPDDLPVTLMPYSALVEDEPFAANLPKGATIKRASPHSPTDKSWMPPPHSESPLASDISSPGIKPVNFEVKPPDPDSRILHPVAMRMSPNGQLVSEPPDRGRAMSDPPPAYDSSDEILTPSKPRAFTYCDSMAANNMAAANNDTIHGRPRPVPKKTTDRGAAPVSTAVLDASLPPPPQLPPRPSQHTRSTSMDLKLKTEINLSAPPVVPPRASPKDASKRVDQLQFSAVDPDRPPKQSPANLKRFEPIPSQEVLTLTSPIEDHSRLQAPGVAQQFLERHRRAVSLDYKQLGPMAGGTQVTATAPVYDTADSTGGSDPYLSCEKLSDDPPLPMVEESPTADDDRLPTRQASRDRRDYQMAIRTHRECNKMLAQANSELNQELQEVMEQRIALEIQLEHLRPFYS